MMHPQMVFVHVVCCQKVTDSLESSVSGSVPDGMGLGSPRTSCLRLHLDGAKLVETDYGRPFRRLLIEGFDAFFLTSYAGSVDRFHVRVR